ncbi:MAG: NAD(P)H-dependent oxidoreductase [Pseudomonadota bacterium]
MKKILIINGHPDADHQHFCDAIVQKYTSAATAAGHSVETINVNKIEFPLLSSKREFDEEEPVAAVAEVQEKMRNIDHLVVVYPLWLGDMPALLKGFFEQLFRPGFAVQPAETKQRFRKLLKGKSARVFVTMGMPGFFYKWFFRAHTLKSLKRNILDFVGFNPVKSTVIGTANEGNDAELKEALREVSKLGQLAN